MYAITRLDLRSLRRSAALGIFCIPLDVKILCLSYIFWSNIPTSKALFTICDRPLHLHQLHHPRQSSRHPMSCNSLYLGRYWPAMRWLQLSTSLPNCRLSFSDLDIIEKVHIETKITYSVLHWSGHILTSLVNNWSISMNPLRRFFDKQYMGTFRTVRFFSAFFNRQHSFSQYWP